MPFLCLCFPLLYHLWRITKTHRQGTGMKKKNKTGAHPVFSTIFIRLEIGRTHALIVVVGVQTFLWCIRFLTRGEKKKKSPVKPEKSRWVLSNQAGRVLFTQAHLDARVDVLVPYFPCIFIHSDLRRQGHRCGQVELVACRGKALINKNAGVDLKKQKHTTKYPRQDSYRIIIWGGKLRTVIF